VAGVGDVPLNDQRGTGFARVQNGRIDVGAFESDLAPLITAAAADFDGNGKVDGSDFLSWQRGFGKSPGAISSDGDADQDGAVGASDLTIWQTFYGQSVGGGEPPAALSEAPSEESAPLLSAAVVASEPLATEEFSAVEAVAPMATFVVETAPVSAATAPVDSTETAVTPALLTLAPALDADEPEQVIEAVGSVEANRLLSDQFFTALSVEPTTLEMSALTAERAAQEDQELPFVVEDQVFEQLGTSL
jgi:hypothetical protein